MSLREAHARGEHSLNRDAACVDCFIRGRGPTSSERLGDFLTATEAVAVHERQLHRERVRSCAMSHQTVVVLEAFATAVLDLHTSLEHARDGEHAVEWRGRAVDAARAVVRAARLLTIKEEYR